MVFLNHDFSFDSDLKIDRMNLEKYIIETSEDFLSYTFFSLGPKGKIKKTVRFKLIYAPPYNYFNLAFGDWNDARQDIDDLIVTDNQDTEKILSTIAQIIMEFSYHYPETFISIQGSTESRIRLYQMKINKYWKDVKEEFEVFGSEDNAKLSPYKPGNKCLIFFGRKKLK